MLVTMYFRRFLAVFAQHRIAGGAAVLAITQLLASLAGLIRDRTLASTFADDLGVVDAYLAAFRPSDLLFQITVMSAFGTVLVPMLARRRACGDDREARHLLAAAFGAGGVVFGTLALLLAILFPLIAPHLVAFPAQQLPLYILFARLALLSNALFVFGSAAGQYLISIQRYWIYGLTPVLYTLGTIGGTLLEPVLGPTAPMIGTVAGAIVYAVIRLLAVAYAAGGLSLRFWHPDLSRMGILMIPRMLALGALQVQLLLFDTLASRLDSGAITVNAYARNFESVAVGVIGIAVAQSVFGPLSAAAASGDGPRYRTYMRKGVCLLLALTVPASVALVLLAPIAARLVSVQQLMPLFQSCLLFYALAIPCESVAHLLVRAYYALHHTLTPAVIGVVATVLAITASTILFPTFGVAALAVGYAIGNVTQVMALAVFLPRCLRLLSSPAISG